MKKKISVLIVCFLALILLCACSSTIQTVEVTRVVQQTVVITQFVTQIVQVNIAPTLLPTNTPVPATPTNVPTKTPTPTRVIDLSAQDGRIVVVQYYTLLGLHLYEQAYQMLSSQMQPSIEKNPYLEGVKNAFIVVKVLKVIPAKEEILRIGGNPPSYVDNWYYVEIFAEGENGMSGSRPNGFQKLYVRINQENKEWKILTFGDSVYQP
jgi:hypothetical protein